jgi:formylglycine-generating enzyme required for sulfatase activity
VRQANGKLLTNGYTGIVLILLPGGRCWIGAQNVDLDTDNFDERADAIAARPLQRVDIHPFLISKYEMTRGQWFRTDGVLPPGGPERGPNKPVTLVSSPRCETNAFRFGLRLPDENEWEYAARAGTHTPWWTGAEEASLQGKENLRGLDRSAMNYPSWIASDPVAWEDGFPGLAPVGSFSANSFGLHDVLGNASEWCAWAPLTQLESFDGRRLALRPARGSNMMNDAECARSAFGSLKNSPDFVWFGLGWRPAMTIDE